jgi:hypothetical protein
VSPFDRLTPADQLLLDELTDTALVLLPARPVPALMRAFSWLEARRVERRWHLLELGVLILRGKLTGLRALAGLRGELEAYLEKRRSVWLGELKKSSRPPSGARGPGWAKFKAALLEHHAREDEQKRAALEALFDAGDAIEVFGVIELPCEGGGTLTTVQGFRGRHAQWPSKREVARRRAKVRRAHGGSPR